jgi:RNA polymerase sigma-70 factor (ECF subfamily)
VLRDPKRILECELLVTQCQRGDRQAFERIVRMWERSLFYYLRRLAPSEADAWDLLQETWLKVFRALSKLRDPRTLPAVLYTTARRAAITRLRAGGIDQSLDTACAENGTDCQSIDDGAVAFDNAEQVHYALDQLPIPQREVLTLFFLQDLSQEEMAELLGVPLGTVKSRLHYAKLAMRSVLHNGDGHGK